jgi:hypothetical protein
MQLQFCLWYCVIEAAIDPSALDANRCLDDVAKFTIMTVGLCW